MISPKGAAHKSEPDRYLFSIDADTPPTMAVDPGEEFTVQGRGAFDVEFELGVVDAGAGTAGIDQPAIRIVSRRADAPREGPPPFRIGPNDSEFLAVQARVSG
jgi:hypothetical protein